MKLVQQFSTVTSPTSLWFHSCTHPIIVAVILTQFHTMFCGLWEQSTTKTQSTKISWEVSPNNNTGQLVSTLGSILLTSTSLTHLSSWGHLMSPTTSKANSIESNKIMPWEAPFNKTKSKSTLKHPSSWRHSLTQDLNLLTNPVKLMCVGLSVSTEHPWSKKLKRRTTSSISSQKMTCCSCKTTLCRSYTQQTAHLLITKTQKLSLNRSLCAPSSPHSWEDSRR